MALDLARFLQMKPTVTAQEVGMLPLTLEQRRELWSSIGAAPALAVISDLFAKLDLSAISGDRLTVERQFIANADDPLRERLIDHLDRQRPVFAHTSLVGCIREVVEFADEDGQDTLTADALTRLVLSITAENDAIDPEFAARVINPDPNDPERFMADFVDFAVHWIAQQLFDYCDPFETLACTVHETWRRGWAPGTKRRVIESLGSSPAEVFAQVMGAPLDDFLALAWIFWNMTRNEGVVRFQRDTLQEAGIGEDVIACFVESCTLPLSDLRQRLTDERMTDASTPWMRYVLQEFPFVAMPDGSFLMLRLQYVVQRMFGDLLYLKVYDKIKACDTGQADRFKNAMNTIFEHRVGQALRRIARHEARFGDTGIIEESQLKTAWQNRRGEHPKICDFAYVQGNYVILIDANNRNLPKKFADRSAQGEDLDAEIRNMFAASKFEQLTSTVREFMRRGWDRPGAHIDSQSRYLPFVVAPNAGMPSNEFTELLVLLQAAPMIAEFDSAALPPSILTWRDLQTLEGISENPSSGRIIELLAAWRLSNYMLVTRRQGIPTPLEHFITSRLTTGLPMSTHDRTVGSNFFEDLRQHAAALYIRHLEPDCG
ncbi:hypothetical protein [Mycobacterium colombiense]|uniref:hypothetical protein n=1 Tax=Mycobacterium colombiense TaxID=339268 RepID=UPI0007ED31A9|nr:hypothetical protein [Mycobacterium colombiense]OBJ26870.1 hypothetical protein A5620_05460 [Mycobacterium colombiense]